MLNESTSVSVRCRCSARPVHGLPLAVSALNEGGLVLCALRAPALDAASGLVKTAVPAHLASLVRGLVFVDASGAATVLDGASVIR